MNNDKLDDIQQKDNSTEQDKMLFRRGLKELDIILEAYLSNYYPLALKDEVKELKILLALDDHSLLALILTPPKNKTKVQTSLFKKLRQM
jgi:succinate dehydrogenase flavin-adding protein (antitoxin of CptAB toxin-antitoxin module)